MSPTEAAELNSHYSQLAAMEIVEQTLWGRRQIERGQVAAVSSFGADSGVLLHMIAGVAPQTPVIFLDTGKHFPETLDFRDRLVSHLGLADLRNVQPEPSEVAKFDGSGMLWRDDPDACCDLRKSRPLAMALAGFDVWFTGRRRDQATTRANMEIVEFRDGRLKVNPLAAWTQADIDRYLQQHQLPRHPLVAQGYPSIGCALCTSRAGDGEDARAGRWRGNNKTECGIHFGENGTTARAS